MFYDGTNRTPIVPRCTHLQDLPRPDRQLRLTDIINTIFDQGTPKGYSAAYFICQKLYANFVYYVPNPTVVDAMATVMLQDNFEVAPVMKALLSSAHFYDVNVIGAQLKSPAEYMGSLVREFALTYPSFNTADPPKAARRMDRVLIPIRTRIPYSASSPLR